MSLKEPLNNYNAEENIEVATAIVNELDNKSGTFIDDCATKSNSSQQVLGQNQNVLLADGQENIEKDFGTSVNCNSEIPVILTEASKIQPEAEKKDTWKNYFSKELGKNFWNPYSQPSKMRSRLLGLDVARGICIFCMLFVHSMDSSLEEDFIIQTPALAPLFGVFYIFGQHRGVFLIISAAINFYRTLVTSYNPKTGAFTLYRMWINNLFSVLGYFIVSPILILFDILSQMGYWVRAASKSNGDYKGRWMSFGKFLSTGKLYFWPDAIGNCIFTSLICSLISCLCLSILELIHRQFAKNPLSNEPDTSSDSETADKNGDSATAEEDKKRIVAINSHNPRIVLPRVFNWMFRTYLARLFMMMTIFISIVTICMSFMREAVIAGYARKWNRILLKNNWSNNNPVDERLSWSLYNNLPVAWQSYKGLPTYGTYVNTLNETVKFSQIHAFAVNMRAYFDMCMTDGIFSLFPYHTEGLLGTLLGFFCFIFDQETKKEIKYKNLNYRRKYYITSRDRLRILIWWYIICTLPLYAVYGGIASITRNPDRVEGSCNWDRGVKLDNPVLGCVEGHPYFMHFFGKAIEYIKNKNGTSTWTNKWYYFDCCFHSSFLHLFMGSGQLGTCIFILFIWEFTFYSARKPVADYKAVGGNLNKRVPLQWLRRYSTYSATFYVLDPLLIWAIICLFRDVFKVGIENTNESNGNIKGGPLVAVVFIVIPVVFYALSLILSYLRPIPTFDAFVGICNHIVGHTFTGILKLIQKKMTGKEFAAGYIKALYPKIYNNYDGIKRIPLIVPLKTQSTCQYFSEKRLNKKISEHALTD